MIGASKNNKSKNINRNRHLLKIIIIRKITNFWHILCKIVIKKILIICLLTAIFTILFVYIFWQKAFYCNLNKINHYLNLVVSNYFDNEFKKISESNFNIIINGNNRISNNEIISFITNEINIYNELKKSHQNPKYHNNKLAELLAKKLKDHSRWIEDVAIKIFLPNKFIIEIKEYQPFVIWQDQGKNYVANKNGHIIEVNLDSEKFDSMIILSGDKAYDNIASLFNIFVINPELSSKIYSATWIGNRRWNIRFENGLLIKLPEDNIDKAWQRLIKILSQKEAFEKLKMIDLRIKDKSYIEYIEYTK